MFFFLSTLLVCSASLCAFYPTTSLRWSRHFRVFGNMAYLLDTWLDSNEEPANGLPRRVASPESFTDSDAGSRYSSATTSLSRKSSASTTPSTAPSLNLGAPPLAATATVAENYLPCEFAYSGCDVLYNLGKSAFLSRTPFVCLEHTRYIISAISAPSQEVKGACFQIPKFIIGIY